MAPGTSTTASSATPTALNVFRHKRNASKNEEEGYNTREGLTTPGALAKDARSVSNASLFGPRTASLANPGNGPGSFSSNLEMTGPRSARPELVYTGTSELRNEDSSASERRQADYREKISKEMKIKIGSENLLEALLTKNAKQTKDQRMRVESELQSSNKKIAELKTQLANEIERSKRPATPLQRRISAIFQGTPLRSPSRQSIDQEDDEPVENDLETESPTFALAEILQSLEAEGMRPDYYVTRANTLVDLLKRYPTLKYDLVWPIFGLRVQMMLLSESREVVAAGYRVTRHAIADRKSLRTIRKLNTDFLVVLSLAKDSKATIEREQALKFVRAFVDVKDGVLELSNAVLRAVISVAEHYEDRLRNVALLTLTEILVRNPEVLVRAGGITPLSEALKDGNYPGSESIVAAFLYLTDTPQQRKLLYGGKELQGPFNLFSDSLTVHAHEERLKTCARSISAIINSWPGLFALSETGFASITSLLMSLAHPAPFARNLLLDLLFDLLHIKPPSWTSSFLAGRRLTTYGRVANLRADPMEHQSRLENEDDLNRANLVDHYRALVLAILVQCGLIEALSELIWDVEDTAVQRKTTLLLSEVLKLADQSLPSGISARIQTLHGTMQRPHRDDTDTELDISSDMVFQIDSVNKTLSRSRSKSQGSHVAHSLDEARGGAKQADPAKPKLSIEMDEIKFRSLMVESQVLSSANYLKWKWDLINDIIEGPLQNPKRVIEAANSTKFLKRLMGFYRPFKYRFSEIRNTKPNQRYVRTGCALVKCLLKTPEGAAYLHDNKLFAQISECFAQLDWVSNLTAAAPVFSADRLTDTLTGGYFNILGALTSDPQGLAIVSRWKMLNMFYHIIDLQDRDDLIQLLLGGMDFTLHSHLRVMLSKALTSCPKTIRIFATQLLRKYATKEPSDNSNRSSNEVAYWAIRLLVTQLYDPVVEVSEVAVQILQEACNRKQYLEYVVKCRPALDHLGEIGAPLLLRFLSTSLGYQYLHGLDYITQEMDDWFLGRNEKYVTLVEASLSRAFSYEPEKNRSTTDESLERQLFGVVPPHFYRELTRTAEGCKLLEASGHFEEFVSTIKDFWAEDEDTETILKVKGSLWAIGNVGSMELGAPFLERTNAVDWIVRIVEQSSVITLRGTAFFALGLISRSVHGAEIMAEKGWDVATNSLGQSLGYILPPDFNCLFKVSLTTGLRDLMLMRLGQTTTNHKTYRYLGADDEPSSKCAER
jgi:rapamycin-insensitive companion of mTOR